MKSCKKLLISGVAALGFLLAACGSGSGGGTQPISVTISNAPTSIVVSATATITAVVANDTSGAGVNWSVSCAGSSCGSVNPTSSAGNSSNTTYTAPSAVPTGNTVKITATSITDNTKSASVTITVTATPTIAVNIQNPPTSLVISTTAMLTAVVSEDSTAAGVTWSVTCGSTGACGSFNPTTSPGNTATTMYTAPAAIPTGSSVTITATSVADSTKSNSVTITITVAPPAVIADGTYVFHVFGEDDSQGPYFAAGAFTVLHGAITGGEEDVADANGGGDFSISGSGSTITKSSDGNIALVLNLGSSSGIGVSGLQTFSGTAVSSTRVLISEFDTFAAGTGSLDLQTSQAAPSGGYAFSVGGLDGANPSNPLFLGGILNISGTSLSVNNSVFDFWDGGSVGQDESFTSGSLTAPDSFGRFTISLNYTQTNGSPLQFDFAGYIVGPNAIRLVELQTDTLQGDLGGNALGQGTNTDTFTAAGVAGSSYTFIGTGVDINSLANYAGGFGLNSNMSVSGVVAFNDNAADQGMTITGGTWTIAPTGRVTLSNVTVSGANSNITGPFTFQLYLDGNGNALELGLDAFQGTTGPSFLQTGDLTAGSYAISAQGFAPANGQPVWSAVGPVTLDSNLNWSGFTDYNVFTGSPVPNVTLSGSTNTSSGLFNISGLDPVANLPSAFGYYPIDSTKVLAIEVDSTGQLGILILEGVTTN